MIHLRHNRDLMIIYIIHNLLVIPGGQVDVLIININTKEIVVAVCCSEMCLPSCTINVYRLHGRRTITEEQSSSCSGKYRKLIKNVLESDQQAK